MKRLILALALCSLATHVMSAASDGLSMLPNPPISDGLVEADLDVFVNSYLLKDKAWKKSLHNFKSGKSMDPEAERRIAQKYKEEYLFAERHFDEKYLVADFGGHTIWCEPASAYVSAQWNFNGAEGQTVDATGVVEKQGVENYTFQDQVTSLYDKLTEDSEHILRALASVSYRPADIDLLGEQTDGLNPDQSGVFTIMTTDLLQQFALGGYELSVSSLDEEVFKVLTPNVTTADNGKAEIRLRGLKPGKAQLKVTLDYYSELHKRALKAEKVFDVRVGARTFEYMVDVTDDIKAKIEYTLSGQFSVWKDNETGEPKCSSSTTIISWAPGLDSLVTTSNLKNGSLDGPVMIVFGNFTDLDLKAEDVTGDIYKGVNESVSDLITAFTTGVVRQKTAEYDPPMLLSLPAEEGTFNYKVEFNETDGMQWNAENPFTVIPKAEKMTSSLLPIAEKLDAGQRVFLTATATIKEK